MVTVLSPREWNAIVDYDEWNDPFTPDDGVALHHGGGSDYASHNPPYSKAKEIQQLQQWEGYHLYSKGWRGLAYGWGVGQTGLIYRIRGFNRYGAHTGDVDGDGIANNDEIIPILFIGSGSRVRLSEAAQASIEWLRANVIEVKSPKAIKLYGHQEISTTGTTCPGKYGMEYVKAHRLKEVDVALTPEDKAWIRAEIRELLGMGTDEDPATVPDEPNRPISRLVVNSALHAKSDGRKIYETIDAIYEKVSNAVGGSDVDVDEAAIADAVTNSVLSQLNLKQSG